jgi:hypothetical protein
MKICKLCLSSNNDKELLKCLNNECNYCVHYICLGLKRNIDKSIKSSLVVICDECRSVLGKEAAHSDSLIIRSLYECQNSNQSLEDKVLDLVSNIKGHEKLAREHKNSYETLAQQMDDWMTISEKNDNDLIHNIETKINKFQKNIEEFINQRFDGISANLKIIEDKQVNTKTSKFSLFEKNSDNSKVSEKIDEMSKKIETLATKSITVAEKLIQTDINSPIEESTDHLTFQNTDHHAQDDIVNMEQNEVEKKSGWRFLGSRWLWKFDWSQFDAKANKRRLQENARMKLKIKKKKESKKNDAVHKIDVSSQNSNLKNSSKVPNKISINDQNRAGPYKTNLKFTNFVSGGIYNPGAEKSVVESQNNNEVIDLNSSSNSQFEEVKFLDPLIPPVVKLTQGSNRYSLARLRDGKIYNMVRLYLAYLHDKDTGVCIDGMTVSSVKVAIASEGLPLHYDKLRDLFLEYNVGFGADEDEVKRDLASYRSYLNNERINRLQQTRNNHRNFNRNF